MKKWLAFVLAWICVLGLVGCGPEPLPEEEIVQIALAHCKTNYDYTEITYDAERDIWEVGFWENNAKLPAQTVSVDPAGNVVYIWWAE